jgi:hypothetical protein
MIGVCVLLVRLGLVIMTMFAGSSLFFAESPVRPRRPARLAVYYGYPSLVNQSAGAVEKAVRVFSGYDVVVLGDGMEFPDRQPGRYPEGDPAEHRKAGQIIAAAKRRNPRTRFYGYVCLGDIPGSGADKKLLGARELRERIRLWKGMGVAGVFLDEAGYDWPGVDRERQNMAVRYIHELGLSAFPNAFYPEELFSLDDLRGKNPHHLPPALDRRDLFLLESFQVKNGEYEDAAEWQQRLLPALKYREQYGSRIFATTTYAEKESFRPDKFNYAWWSAWLYDLDGFSWGEPNFAAVSGMLPDRRCPSAGLLLSGAKLKDFEPPSSVGSDGIRFWRRAGPSRVVIDSRDHSVRLVSSPATQEAGEATGHRPPPPAVAFDCGAIQ